MDGDKAQGKEKVEMRDIWKTHTRKPRRLLFSVPHITVVLYYVPSSLQVSIVISKPLEGWGRGWSTPLKENTMQNVWLTNIDVSPLSLSIFPKTVE